MVFLRFPYFVPWHYFGEYAARLTSLQCISEKRKLYMAKITSNGFSQRQWSSSSKPWIWQPNLHPRSHGFDKLIMHDVFLVALIQTKPDVGGFHEWCKEKAFWCGGWETMVKLYCGDPSRWRLMHHFKLMKPKQKINCSQT